MSSSHQSVTLKVISSILSFFISIILFAFVTILIISLTVLNKQFMTVRLANSNYFANITDEVKSEYVAYGLAGGIPDTVFNDAVDETQVYRDVSGILSAAYDGTTYKVDTDTMGMALYERFVAYAAEQKITVSDEVKKNLLNMVDLCIDDYTNKVSSPLIVTIIEYVRQFRTMAYCALAVLAVLLIGLGIFLYRIHEWKHRIIRYIQFSVLGTAGMLLVIPSAIMLSGIVGRLGITAQSLFLFVNSYVNGILQDFIISGFALILITSTLGYVIYKIVKNQYV